MSLELKIRNKTVHIHYNAPVTVTFSILCLLVLLLDAITKQSSTVLLFSVYSCPLSTPWAYIRFFTHVLGHVDISHLIGNITLILVLGPGLEERYGSAQLLFAMLLTAFLSGLAEFLLFPNTMLLGASGIVFLMVVMSSVTEVRNHDIPITLILVFLLYIGGEVVDALTVHDNISQLSHIIGGVSGAVLGLKMRRGKR